MNLLATNIWAVVPAAGVGMRFGDKIPKQYCKIHGQYVIEHTLSALLKLPTLSKVIVCLCANDQYWQTCKFTNHHKVMTALGGKTRAQSVLNGLLTLSGLGAKNNDLILVHDCARPNISIDDINNLINVSKTDNCASALAYPAYDALKIADSESSDAIYIKSNLERSNIWHAVTPQIAQLGLLIDALKKYPNAGDEAEALLNSCVKVRLVRADKTNVKLTTTSDLEILKALLK